MDVSQTSRQVAALETQKVEPYEPITVKPRHIHDLNDLTDLAVQLDQSDQPDQR